MSLLRSEFSNSENVENAVKWLTKLAEELS